MGFAEPREDPDMSPRGTTKDPNDEHSTHAEITLESGANSNQNERLPQKAISKETEELDASYQVILAT